jgi:membrane fusion protein
MKSLFRQEVVDHRADRLHGEIILTQTLNAWVLTGALAAMVGAVAIWLTVGEYARIETARGILVTTSGSSKVIALRPGVVSALMVKDGDRVVAGQKLALVDSEQPSESGARYSAQGAASLAAQEALAAQQITLLGAQAQSERARLTATLAGLEQQRTSIAQQQVLQRQLVESARQTFEQIAKLVDSGFVSKVEYERRRQAHISAQQGLSQLNLQLSSLEADYARARVEFGRAQINAESGIVTVRNTVQSLQQQKSRLISDGGYSVEAPIA